MYPLHPAHVAGSFDLTHFTVSVDDQNAYFRLKFRALSDPGWHPEYGYQLTCTAIAIDTDGKPDSGRDIVDHNARFRLPAGFGYERLILIGGGVRLEDEQGKILAEYVPSAPDVRNPLGNAADGSISFAIPLEYVGKPENEWGFAVLTGGQDDHGGAGLGEFRSVERTAAEWSGGGRLSEGEPNIYDTLFHPRR
jgi:carbohydrate-binding DOMON domain-containing protein